MSIFGRDRLEWVVDFDEDWDDGTVANETRPDLSKRDNSQTAPQPYEAIPDELSPPLPELPTWDSVPFSNLPEVLRPSFNSGYELRPGPRIEGKSILPTFLDQDGTATYHPDCEQDPYLHPPVEIYEGIRRRRPIRPDDGQTRSRAPKTITWQRGRFEGKRLPVTLSFKNEKGKAALVSFGSSLDNWPKSAWRLPNEEIDWKSWWDAVPAFDDDDSQDSSSGRRERQKTVACGQIVTGDIEYRAVEELTLGHPEARGCKGCFELGQRCPLLDEGSRYPCDICVEDGCDCELVMEPAKKRGCLNCGHKRISCSYREMNTDHSLPCSNCATRGLKCIAGPASGRTRTGPALDSALYGKVHTIHKAFTRSRQSGRSKGRRTLDQNNIAPKGFKARKSDEGDIFEETPAARPRIGCVNLNTSVFQDFFTFNPKLQRDPTQFIRTQLAHPIILNCDGVTSCDWCLDISYGIFGLGPALEVEVLDMNDGAGHVEVSGGYFGAGLESSRMCTRCTMQRLEIAACLEHNVEDLGEIGGIAHDSINPDSVMDYLMPGMAASAPFTWCSVCPYPALYTCCKPANEEVQALLGLKQNSTGCGLSLCKNCAETLVHDTGGDLDALVRSKIQHDDQDLSLRADVDLILRGGEVVRRMGWMFTH